MMFGILNLFCPICGEVFRYGQSKAVSRPKHRYFGILCSMACHDAAETKYARMILGKDDV